jgi:hypothetical protein
VALQWFYVRNARILAATSAVGAPLIIGFRLQRDARPFGAHRVAGIIKLHACDSEGSEQLGTFSRGGDVLPVARLICVASEME